MACYIFLNKNSLCTYSLGNIMVGPLTVKKPKPLPPDFEEFISDSGRHGFIVVSFGSYVELVLNKEKLDMLATAFGKLKQRVLWRLKGRKIVLMNKSHIH